MKHLSQKQPPKPFGHSIKSEWPLDPDIVYLNHGTVGVTPRAVLDFQREILLDIESNPSRRLLRDVAGQLGAVAETEIRRAAEQVAEFFGAKGEDLAFVSNATDGANAVLRSFDFTLGDAVLVTDTTYGGVLQAVRYTGRLQGVDVVTADLPCPINGKDEVLAALEKAITPRTRLAVLDHIVSETGAVLPVREMTDLCHTRGIKVMIDGAHAPGQLDLNIPQTGADWYVGNLHKWALAPRGCGILWVHKDAQVGLHPNIISWPLDEGFPVEFDWTGTRDASPFLAAPAGLDFLKWLGPENMRRYNHDLLWDIVHLLGERWGGQSLAERDMTGFMAAISLPDTFPVTSDLASRLRNALLYEHQIEAPVFAYRDKLWTRISIQVYNEISDALRLADAIEACRGMS